MAINKVQFATIFDEDGTEIWELFDSIEDAVSANGDGVEVFRAHFRSLGRYRRKAVLAQVKNKKRKKKR